MEKNKLNNRGQSLVEYLLLVALIGIASMAILRSLNDVVTSQFANVAHKLNGDERKARSQGIRASNYRKKDMSDFYSGAVKKNDKQ